MTSGRNMLFCRLVFKFGCRFSNEGFKHCNLVVLAHVILVSHSILVSDHSYSPPLFIFLFFPYLFFFHIYVAIYSLYLPLTNVEMLSKKWGLSTFFFLIYQTKLVAFLISYSFRISFLWPIQSDRVICELLQGEYFSNQDLAPFCFRDTSPIPSQ